MDTIKTEVAVQGRDVALLINGPHPADILTGTAGTALDSSFASQEGITGRYRQQSSQRTDIATEEAAL